jgi:hypothetical protein
MKWWMLNAPDADLKPNNMNDYLKQLAEEIKKELQEKRDTYKNTVYNSQQFQEELKFLGDFSWDAINTIRTISFYSTRATYIYKEFLTVHSSDDLIQSIVGLQFLVSNGIQNMAKREIRYLLEMTTKYLVVDQEQSGKDLATRTEYLKDSIPNASIEVVDRLSTPFIADVDKEFKAEVKDIFYKACAYVHPSQKQIQEQITNYSRGIHIGLETARMLSDVNKLLFRSYDIVLTMLFIGFGHSMSGDLFIEYFDTEPKWKFHKGKYVKQYSKLFDNKIERQGRKQAD